MTQKRSHSLLEALTNYVIGYLLAVITQLIIFPFFDIRIPIRENFIMAAIFTCIGLVRTYTLRRVFNRITVRRYDK